MQHNTFSLSPAAAKEIRRLSINRFSKDHLSKQPKNQNITFRLKVIPGGCSGLYYDMSFENIPHSSEGQIASSDDECLFESEGIRVVIDRSSWEKIEGIGLDYFEDLMGGGFRFSNPKAISVCNCGNSFALAEEK